MPKLRTYPYLTVTLLVGLLYIGCRVNQPAGPARVTSRVTDTPSIAIDSQLNHLYPCVDTLIRTLIDDKNGIFQRKEFREFFGSPKTRLLFSFREFRSDTSGFSSDARISSGLFIDTIFLNKSLFTKASREFLASVVIHESIHAYISWCCVSFVGGRNGVDETYLKKHFHSYWLKLTGKPFPDNDEEHVLMSEFFVGAMFRNLYRYTNRNSDPLLRDTIARALTWGSLFETPKGRDLNIDTCYFRNIDIWARNIDADSTKGVSWGKCSITGVWFLHRLELQSICK